MCAPLRIVSALLILSTASGCITGTKRLQTIHAAVNNVNELERLCSEKIEGACALMGKETRPLHTVPILQSVSSQAQARFVVVIPSGKTVGYFHRTGGQIHEISADIFPALDQKHEVHQFELFNLSPTETHEIFVLGANGDLWDQRQFKTLDIGKKNARVAVVSCADDSFKSVQTKIWPELAEQKPDAVILLGDNAYVDKEDGKKLEITSAEDIWRRYGESRDRLVIFKVNPLIPVIATWDDHDYGKNDGDRTFSLKAESADVFFAYFHQRRPAPQFERGPGVASWWTAFGAGWALVDDRTFRSPNQMDLPDQTHFGFDQEKWIAQKLKKEIRPVFLAGGDQFFGGYHNFESYEGSHPKSFKEQILKWRKTSRSPLVFLSGDRHLTEIIKVPSEYMGYPTFEITSSGIHAAVFPDAFERAPSPMQLAGVAGQYNYTILEIQTASKAKLKINVKAFGLGAKELYQKTLTVSRP